MNSQFDDMKSRYTSIEKIVLSFCESLNNNPFYAVQTHIIRVFSPGVWASLGAGYEEGSRSTVNGKKNDDNRDGFIAALSAGVPITANQGVKLSYIWSEINTSTAKIVHSDTVVLAWSIRF